MVQTCKRTQMGALKPPILVGDLEEDAPDGVILEVHATNELSNQDHKVEEVLSITHDVIFLEALPLFQIARKGVEMGLGKLESVRNHTLQKDMNYTPKEGALTHC